MAVKKTQADFVNNWRSGVAGAGTKYLQGIDKSDDWAARYVAAEPLMVAGLQRAISEGRMTRGVNALGTQGWRNKVKAKGSGSYTGSANNADAQANVQRGAAKLFGFLNAAENAIAGTPRGDFSQNMQRMTAFVTAMHNEAQQAKANG